MKQSMAVGLACVAIAGLSLAAGAPADQAATPYDGNLFNFEVIKHDSEPLVHTEVMWIPEQHWAVLAYDAPSMDAQTVHDLQWLLKPYLVFFIYDGKAVDEEHIAFRPEPEVRHMLRLKDAEGNIYQPVAPGDIGHDVQALLDDVIDSYQHSSFAGGGLNYYVFRARKPGGAKIATADTEGRFSIQLGERQFRFRTPLGALLPKKTCPTCGEELNGAWQHCPWDGTKLPEP